MHMLTVRQTMMYQDQSQPNRNQLSSVAHQTGSRPLKNVWHLEGAAALLQVRQQRNYPQNLPLEQAVRRKIVSKLIMLTASCFCSLELTVDFSDPNRYS
jgi:hypothetical protein